MKRLLLVSLMSFVGLGTFACGDDDNGAQGPNQPGQPTANVLSDDDRDFIRDAALSGLFEVQSSQLALQKATREDIRTFAQRMVDEHTKLNEELQNSAAGWGEKLPTELNFQREVIMEELRQREGADFDRRYMEEQVNEHGGAIELFDRHTRKGMNQDLRNWAQSHVKDLQDHFRQAKDIQNQLQQG